MNSKLKIKVKFEGNELYNGEFNDFKPAKQLLKDLELKIGRKR